MNNLRKKLLVIYILFTTTICFLTFKLKPKDSRTLIPLCLNNPAEKVNLFITYNKTKLPETTYEMYYECYKSNETLNLNSNYDDLVKILRINPVDKLPFKFNEKYIERKKIISCVFPKMYISKSSSKQLFTIKNRRCMRLLIDNSNCIFQKIGKLTLDSSEDFKFELNSKKEKKISNSKKSLSSFNDNDGVESNKLYQEYLHKNNTDALKNENLDSSQEKPINNRDNEKNKKEIVIEVDKQEINYLASYTTNSTEVSLEKLYMLMLSTEKNRLKDREEDRKLLNKIEQDVNILKQDVNILKKDVSILKQDVNILKQDVNILKQDVSILKEDVNTIYGDSFAVKLLLNTKINKLAHGTGTLAYIKNKTMIVTNRHVLVDEDYDNCIYKLDKVLLYKNNSEIINNTIEYEIFFHPHQDLALISFPSDNYMSANISNADPVLGKKLNGICYVDDGVYNSGRILEKVNDTILTDMGGAPGFSGCGYFNRLGELNAIHEGSTTFLHSNNNKEKNSYNKAKNMLIESTKLLFDGYYLDFNQDNLTKTFIENMEQFVTLNSRNPRTIVISSKYLLDEFLNAKDVSSLCHDY